MDSNSKSTEALIVSESSSIEDIVKVVTDRNKNQRKRMLRGKAFISHSTPPSSNGTSPSVTPRGAHILQVESADVHTAPTPIPAPRKSMAETNKRHEIVEIFSASDEIEVLTDQQSMTEGNSVEENVSPASGDNQNKMFFARSRNNTVIDIEPFKEEQSDFQSGDFGESYSKPVSGPPKKTTAQEQIVNEFKDRRKMMKKSMDIKSSSTEQVMTVEESVKTTKNRLQRSHDNVVTVAKRGRKSIQFLKQSKEKALLIKATEPLSKARQLLKEKDAKKLESALKRSADSNAALKGGKRVSRKTPSDISIDNTDSDIKPHKSIFRKSQQTLANEIQMEELNLSKSSESECQSDDDKIVATTEESCTTRSHQTSFASTESSYSRAQSRKPKNVKIYKESRKSKRNVADEYNYSKIIGIYLHETGNMKCKLKFNRLQAPRVKVSIFNKSKGCLLDKSDAARNVIINYEPSNLEHIQPIISEECRFKTNGALQYSCVWEELLVVNDDIMHIQNGNVIIFFELVDLEPVQQLVPSKLPSENESTGWTKLCWGFLKLMGDNKEYSHLETKCKLQLYAYQRIAKKQRLSDSIWNQFNVKQKVQYPSTLSVTVKGISSKTQDISDIMNRPKTALQIEKNGTLLLDASTLEEDVSELIESKKNLQLEGTSDVDPLLEFQRNWIKLPGKSFQCPNKIKLSLNAGTKGSMITKFHPNGNFVAFSSHSDSENNIVVAKLPNMQLKWTLQGHTSIIYDFDWANTTEKIFPLVLLSVSSDRTAIVWSIFKDMYKFQLLPHTSFVYSGKFLRSSQLGQKISLITGGRDCILRIWTVTIDDKNNKLPKLLQELSGHDEYITAISIHSPTKLFTSDWSGALIEWCYNKKVFTKSRTTKLNTQIISLVVHERRDRLYTFGSDNLVRVIHLTAFTVVQQIGHQETCHSRTSRKIALSPCGSLLFIPETDGIGCWSTSTGMQINSLNLNAQSRNYRSSAFVSSIDYHPFDMLLIAAQYGTCKNGIVLFEMEPNQNSSDDEQSKLTQRVAELKNECGFNNTGGNNSLTEIIKRIDSMFSKEKNQTDDFKSHSKVVSQGIQTSLFSSRETSDGKFGTQIDCDTYSISIKNSDDDESENTFVIKDDDKNSVSSTGTYVVSDKQLKRKTKKITQKLDDSHELNQTFEILNIKDTDSDDTTTSEQLPQ